MKRFKYLFICLLALNLVGCEDYFGEDSNVDPDNPTTATVNVLLPQVQLRMAYLYGGDFTRFLGINTQHVDGVGRQFVVYNNYGILPGDLDAAWTNTYSGILNSNKVMKEFAVEAGANHYLALGLMVESFTIMNATDFWGDVPYSDAVRFAENGGVYAPQIDSQEDIYNTIFSNLAEARTLLEGESGGVDVGIDDLIYGGNIANWIALTNVLEARARLHLSKVNGNAYAEVLTALNRGGFADAGAAAGLQFGAAATENAPWFQYIEQRDDCETGASYKALLESMGDPRVATYGFEHSGDNPVFVSDRNLPLLSFSEQEFMRAEALMGTGDAGGAFDAFTTAVTASFAEAGVGGADAYITAQYGTSVSMEDIMLQKYIALYTSPEAFNDWRRSGIPALTPNSGTVIPRRLPYSETEQFANANIPTPRDITIFDRVWWDAQ